MGKALRSLFNLYPGEGKKAALFVLLALLWASGCSALATLSSGLFVQHIGTEGLLTTYGISAVLLCCSSVFLAWCIPKVSLKHLLCWVFLGHIVWNMLIFTTFPSTQFWYCFKMGNSVFAVIICSVFWSFVDQYYDLQTGKRCFCLFSAVMCLGDASGAALVSFGCKSIELFHLVILCLVWITCAIPTVLLISKVLVAFPEEGSLKTVQSKLPLKKLVKMAACSKFTITLLLFYLFINFISIFTEYHYSAIFESVLQKEHRLDDITAFFGRSSMGISLGNMLFGFLLYSRVVKRVGIHNVIMVTPLLFFILYLFFGAPPSMLYGVLAMVVLEGFSYVLDENNINLLLSAVPHKIKNQIRIAIDFFFEPMGMLISALLLFVFRSYYLKIGLALAGCAILLGLVLRTFYHSAIFQNLVASTLRFHNHTTSWFETFSKHEKNKIARILLGHLNTSNEDTQLLAYKTLLDLNHPKLLPPLLDRFAKMSISNKIAILDLFSKSRFHSENIVLETFKRWAKLPHPLLKGAIHLYLAQHHYISEKQSLDDIEDPNHFIRGAAVLAMCSSQNPYLLRRAKEELKKLFSSQKEDHIIISLKIIGLQKHQSNIPLLLPLINDIRSHVAQASAQAIVCSATHQDASIAQHVIDYLHNTPHTASRMLCFKALEVLCSPHQVSSLLSLHDRLTTEEWGSITRLAHTHAEQMIPFLITILHDPSFHIQARMIATRVLAKHLHKKEFISQASVVLEKSIDQAFFYLYHAHAIQKQPSDCHLWSLEKLLFYKYELTMDFLLQTIALIGKVSHPEVLAKSMNSSQQKIRGQAYETVEKACPSHLFKKLAPLLTETRENTTIHMYLKQGHPPWSIDQLLKLLEHSSLYEDRIVVYSIKEQLHLVSA